MGVSVRTVFNLEHGSPKVAIGIAFEAATLLGVSLFGGDGPELAKLARQGRETLALLPSRVRTSLEMLFLTISEATVGRRRQKVPREGHVWVWLPKTTSPVVAGLLEAVHGIVTFSYGRSYLDRPEAVALYEPELPLQRGRIQPPPGLDIASCIRDAGPDAWGQRVILLDSAEADAIIDAVVTTIREQWADAS